MQSFMETWALLQTFKACLKPMNLQFTMVTCKAGSCATKQVATG
jgi:hypothetical protein